MFPLETHARGTVLQSFFKRQQLINSYRRITPFFTNVFEKVYFQSLVVNKMYELKNATVCIIICII